MGVSQQLLNEITAFEENALIVQEQRQGPFRRWVVTQRFERLPDGTRFREAIEFEPPGGVLGLLVGAEAIRKDVEQLFAYRERKLREIFA